jgi:hypothetical protein
MFIISKKNYGNHGIIGNFTANTQYRKEEKRAMQKIMQSSRMKPFVIGVANRYALFMERKKQWTNERASGDISSLNNSLVKRT